MERRALDPTAFSLMTLLCFLWGVQQVVVKLTAPFMSLVMQGGVRSLLATVLVFAWARARGVPLFKPDGTLKPGLLAGLLFGIEFVFIYAGLGHTAASRMVVFLYLTPPLTVLGLTLFVPGERLNLRQWVGVLVSFGGIMLAFSEGFLAERESTWLGDLFGVCAALTWAATTVVVRGSALARASASKTLLYQLAVASVILLVGSRLIGEPGIMAVTPWVVASMIYQGAIVAFASFLVWFWLLTRYYAARLSAFSFLTPLFGVLAGVVILHEPLSPLFAVAAALVAAGIVLVNLGGARAPLPPTSATSTRG